MENVHEMSRYSFTIFYDFISHIKGQVNFSRVRDSSEKQNAQHLMIVEKQEIY